MSLIAAPDPPLVDADGRFWLRPWVAGDAPALAEAWGDPDIAAWCAVPDELSAVRAARWIAGWEARVASCTSLDLAVVGPDGDLVYGEVAVRRLSRPASSGEGSDAYELGWWLGPAHRGRGLATAAVTLLVEWASSRAPDEPLVARIPAGHIASERVAVSAGLRRRGRLDDGRILWAYEP